MSNFKVRRESMCSIRGQFLLSFFLSFAACQAVSVADVQKLTVNNFFSEWSKFLDQVLQEQKEQISPENNKVYQAFIQQAKTLNIPKVTGNKKSIVGMQEQMKGVQQRMGGEKKVVQDWQRLSESFANAAQPLSVENEKEYKALMRQARDVGVAKTQLDAMETKMNELRAKLGSVAPAQPTIPDAVMAPETLVRKEEPQEAAPVQNEELPPVHEEPLKEEKPAANL